MVTWSLGSAIPFDNAGHPSMAIRSPSNGVRELTITGRQKVDTDCNNNGNTGGDLRAPMVRSVFRSEVRAVAKLNHPGIISSSTSARCRPRRRRRRPPTGGCRRGARTW